MKTIRLLYPDHLSGGLDTYYFGAHLLAHILPPSPGQPVFEVPIAPPDGRPRPAAEGVCAREEVAGSIRAAARILESEQPRRVITIGGSCIVSQAPFDYLLGLYPDAGILWIDAHPDVSAPEDGYPNAHAMVLRSLLGQGAFSGLLQNPPFRPENILYVGLQSLHDYQAVFLRQAGIPYRVQTQSFVPAEEIAAFARRFSHLLVHFDIDVLDPAQFHSTYFANPSLVGDGSGGGRMTLPQLAEVLHAAEAAAPLAGLTIAEYLPFDEEKLRSLLAGLDLFR